MIFLKKVSHKTKVNLFAISLIASVFLISLLVCISNLLIMQMLILNTLP